MALIADVKGTLTLRSRRRKSLDLYVKEAVQSTRWQDETEMNTFLTSLLRFLLPVSQVDAPQFYLTEKEGEGGS
jgi:hypothetical protein